MLGSGTRALAHVRVIARVRDLKSVRLWSPASRNRAHPAETPTAHGDPRPSSWTTR
ncbi:hypothetical protein [Streptomyces canus]|uniref:hypothetical protein n=1 Tax=Streptomyces canus TaxID=58343 RepID=UPI0032437C4E|nr:hypothetical protein OH837_08425 [Streptomyces canus]